MLGQEGLKLLVLCALNESMPPLLTPLLTPPLPSSLPLPPSLYIILFMLSIAILHRVASALDPSVVRVYNSVRNAMTCTASSVSLQSMQQLSHSFSFIHSFIHTFVYSFIYLYIHSFIHTLMIFFPLLCSSFSFPFYVFCLSCLQ